MKSPECSPTLTPLAPSYSPPATLLLRLCTKQPFRDPSHSGVWRAPRVMVIALIREDLRVQSTFALLSHLPAPVKSVTFSTSLSQQLR